MWIKSISAILLLGLSLLSFTIYRALYPFEAFYIQEWNYNTDLPFPSSASFIWKTATYPDQFGDYTSTAIIKLSGQEFKKLQKDITQSFAMNSDSLSKGYKGIFNQYLPTELKESPPFTDYYFSSIKAYFKIGFNQNNNSIIFQRHSS
jgi:hypothetical protein